MKNIANLDDLLSLNDKIVRVRRNYTLAIVIILVSCLLMTAGTFMDELHDSLMMFTICFGVILAAVGVLLLFQPSAGLVYSETGEPLKKFDIYYDVDYDGNLLHDLKDCSFDKLVDMSQAPAGRKLATVYTTKSGKMRIAQIFKFVPYEYTPFTDPIVFSAS